ncbi:XrtA/PEP-CTERM system histidine kinase PrsK [Denitromonas iodatirespirans]|uniref:histidine kinase n=1 Tax=Denitromonas iodatirespirans TaxID=2795389 RepID=A0A944DPE6_DENI1|nr:XrtA/PEP-CTERM system histidine kinase PrsK [Denitromonas iodatirespirans]MBT0962254.1 PEP-CTERM system histidine kinase PrsK [Denitromonas iodatirespirans]
MVEQTSAAVWGYALAAVAFGLFGVYLAAAWRGRGAGGRLLLAVGSSAAWCVASAAMISGLAYASVAAILLSVVRDAAWLAFVVGLIGQIDGSHRRWPARVAVVVVVLRLATAVMAVLNLPWPVDPQRALIFLHLVAAVYALVLVEQLYRLLPAESRWGLKPFCLAMAASAVFDLYLYADAFLFGAIDRDIWSIRGLAHALVLPLIAISASRVPGWAIRLSVSREMVFHSTALAASGLYLLLVAAAGYYVRYFGGDWGRALQVTLFFAALLLLGVVAVSGTQRARLRVWLNKHLFPYRYDYRNEWLKFTRALSASGDHQDLGQTTIRALADLVESAGGGLWLDDGQGRFVMRARLNMPESSAEESADDPLCRFLAAEGWVFNLEEYRMRPKTYGNLTPPRWLSEMEDGWLVVPLTADEALIGFVVLLAPRTPVDINWEVLDLLKSAQRQAASYLARMQAAEALIEARKFDAFNRMSAFVVHDLKNLVAQLSLMLKNAERHKDNPEFQADMLETVAHVEKKMRDLMQQLQKKTTIERDRPMDLGLMLLRIGKQRAHLKPPVTVTLDTSPVLVSANAERLERVVGHIVQNALDATGENGMVTACLRRLDAGRAQIEIADTGCGMSPQFVRDQLFRPFQTTKASGMGIGVFEARQYLRELGGDIRVDSTPGEGTVMQLTLPVLPPTADDVAAIAQSDAEP